MNDEHYAEFISYYRDRIENEESYRAFHKLNRDYNAEDARLDRQQGKPVENLNLKMDNIGKSKTADTKAAKSTLLEDYKVKADQTARSYGFRDKSYDEHVKQKEKEKEPVSPAVPEAQPEAKQQSQLTEREIKWQAVLEEIRQITERNRNQDRDQGR